MNKPNRKEEILHSLATMLETWGTISWSDAIQPAVEVATEGFTIGPWLAQGWAAPRACRSK